MRELTNNAKAVGVDAAAISAFCFGGSGPFAKPLIAAGLSSVEVAWLRLAGGALLMLPFALRHTAVLRQAPKLLIAYGLFAIAGVQAFYFAAIASVPVGVALLIEFLGPVLVLGWIRLVRRQPVSRTAMTGIVLAVAGLTCVVELWSGLGFHPAGLVLALGAAGCQAAFFLLSDSSGAVHPAALAAYGLLLGAVVVGVLARPWEMPWELLAGDVELAGHGFPAVLAVGWIVVISTVAAYLTGIIAVRKLSPPVAGGVAFLEPVVATVLAWLLLGESLGGLQLFGGALILLGAYIAQRAVPAERTSRPRAAEPAG